MFRVCVVASAGCVDLCGVQSKTRHSSAKHGLSVAPDGRPDRCGDGNRVPEVGDASGDYSGDQSVVRLLKTASKRGRSPFFGVKIGIRKAMAGHIVDINRGVQKLVLFDA